MKKILSVIIAFMLIFSCFAVTVFANNYGIIVEDDDYDPFSAKEPVASFSENYEKFYLNGVPHSRVNASAIKTQLNYNLLVRDEHNTNFYSGGTIYADLTDKQSQEVDSIEIEHNYQCTIFKVALYFKDGSTLTATYLNDDYLDDYNNVINGNVERFVVDFTYPSGNMVETTREKLMGETVTFARSELSDWSDFDFNEVTAKNDDGSIAMVVGAIIIIDDNYYYLHNSEAGVSEDVWYGSIGGLAGLPLHKISDEELIKEFDDALVDYYEDDYGILYDDDATESISIVFFAFVFAFIPLVILVIFLIKAIRGKGVYKKMYFTVSALCVAELVVFVIMTLIIAKLN